jgi:uncharacterized OB-fold protein
VTVAALPDDWTQGQARLVVSRCRSCGHRWYLRREACPACASADIEGVPAAGTGVVAAGTTVHRLAAGAVSEPGPVGIALVDLDEGVRVMGRCTPGIPIGVAVRVRFTAPGGDGTGSSLVPFFEAISA